MNKDRHTRILAMAGHKSYGLIAKELDVSRGVVAGIIWRDRWPTSRRIKSPNSDAPNKCGIGHRGGRKKPAPQNLIARSAP